MSPNPDKPLFQRHIFQLPGTAPFYRNWLVRHPCLYHLPPLIRLSNTPSSLSGSLFPPGLVAASNRFSLRGYALNLVDTACLTCRTGRETNARYPSQFFQSGNRILRRFMPDTIAPHDAFAGQADLVARNSGKIHQNVFQQGAL